MKDAVLIASERSRDSAAAAEAAKRRLPERGVRLVESLTVPNSAAACKAAKRAIKSGHRLIIVVGGDGAITTAVKAFAYKKAVLAVVPAGTGNSFALNLGLRTVDDALEAIVSGREVEVDLGVVNGTYFANITALGLTSEIASETQRGLKRIAGVAAYGFAAVKPLVTHKAFRTRVKWENNSLDFETHQALVASGRYFGHEALLPDASIDDGLLSFFATASAGRTDMLRTYFALLRGSQTLLRNAHFFQAKKISVKCKPRQLITIDGKAIAKTPAKFSIARRALRVMMPQAAGDDE
ncbi:MAG: YegS/Rv2252/BmrU family lipid kinase [Candidatus Eremiobacteraeota bacterium]|nr:YegS/Rv2252/BmrU family lipid kinase [Candidatus Eremiobacteraeota bacterium]